MPNFNEGSFKSHGITCFSVALNFSNVNIYFIIQNKLIELSFKKQMGMSLHVVSPSWVLSGSSEKNIPQSY